MTEMNSEIEWIGGKPCGCVSKRADGYQVVFAKSLGIPSEYFKSKADAIEFQREKSDELKLTKNMYRIVGDYLEVQLQNDKIMKCDIEHLPVVQERIWTARKSKDKYCWYVASRKSVKRNQEFCLFHRRICPEYSQVDHINGDGLDNRTCNLRDGSGRVNAMNKRIQKNNKSGFKGVFYVGGKKPRWRSQWMDLDTGKKKSKSFSVKKYGAEEAKRLAIEHRNSHAPKITELINLQ